MFFWSTYTMDMGDLPDMYARGPQARGMRAFILITNAHVTSVM